MPHAEAQEQRLVLSAADITRVAFDVAVVSEKSSAAEGGIRIAVFGAGGEGGSANQTATRIKFEFPVSLPRQLASLGARPRRPTQARV